MLTCLSSSNATVFNSTRGVDVRPSRAEWKTVAFDDDNQISIFEIYHEFSHKAYGDIRQTEVHVQRWRDGKIYDESIYLMPLNEEADSEACS